MTQQDIDYEWVQKKPAHAKLIMEWRNDPDTRRWSFHSEEKLWDSFWQEFLDAYFPLPHLPPLFALIDGQRVAFVRFRPQSDEGTVDISINVAPRMRGKGLGAAILKTVSTLALGQGISRLLALIKDGNLASIRAFEKAGYSYLDSIQKDGLVHRYVKEATIQEKSSVYVIAEAGSNWRMGTSARDLKMAKALIEVASEAGANACKFQTYKSDTVYVANAGKSDYLADGGIQEEISSIFDDLAMPYEMIGELAEYCKECKIDFMSSPFSPSDFQAVDPYVSRHKLASYEISHLRLIELMAKSGKATYMSTGAADTEDIAWAVRTYQEMGGKDLTLFQCTAKYPANSKSMNLRALPLLKTLFNVPVGLSDHSAHPVHAPLMAVALGASAIEKHFTLDKRLPGPDHYFAITAKELSEMVLAIREAEKMLGHGEKRVLNSEEELRYFARRGLQATHPIKKGETFKEDENVAILRPGKQRLGVHPKELSDIEGKAALRDIPLGDGIQPGDW